jgi:hypothetical protein
MKLFWPKIIGEIASIASYDYKLQEKALGLARACYEL